MNTSSIFSTLNLYTYECIQNVCNWHLFALRCHAKYTLSRIHTANGQKKIWKIFVQVFIYLHILILYYAHSGNADKKKRKKSYKQVVRMIRARARAPPCMCVLLFCHLLDVWCLSGRDGTELNTFVCPNTRSQSLAWAWWYWVDCRFAWRDRVTEKLIERLKPGA